MGYLRYYQAVSTHSRLKAAGNLYIGGALLAYRFNTQPPEGGWDNPKVEMKNARAVSTHSRLKAAGLQTAKRYEKSVCFNTQPPEGGWLTNAIRPKITRGFNTQPPEGGWPISSKPALIASSFQHTAA